jgi:hypothetical protein
MTVTGGNLTGSPTIQGATAPTTIQGGTITGPFTAPVAQTLSAFATLQGLPGSVLGDGSYTLQLICRAKLNPTSVGEYVGTFTVAGNNVTPVVPPADTTTEVVVPVTSDWGTAVHLQADVADVPAPATLPTGTVQFKADGTAIGSPVTLVSGTATLDYVGLGFGTHAITADYTPSGNFNPSSTTTAGSVDVVLAAPSVVRAANVTGTARVGGSLVCNTGTFAGATSYTYQWLKNGVATGAASSVFTKSLVVADYNTTYSCKVTGINPIGTATSTSVGVKIAAGPAAIATVKPKIVGTALVGRTLTASKGTWSPVAAYTYTYTWKRGTVAISHAASYKVGALDKGKYLTLMVTAARTGYLTGTATSAAVKAS